MLFIISTFLLGCNGILHKKNKGFFNHASSLYSSVTDFFSKSSHFDHHHHKKEHKNEFPDDYYHHKEDGHHKHHHHHGHSPPDHPNGVFYQNGYLGHNFYNYPIYGNYFNGYHNYVGDFHHIPFYGNGFESLSYDHHFK